MSIRSAANNRQRKANYMFTRTIAYIVTNAPPAYDYGYTFDLGATNLRDSIVRRAVETSDSYALEMSLNKSLMSEQYPVRVVQVDPSNAEYQAGRYSSGMYLSLIVD